MAFTDASSNMEEHNLKVFVVLTHSIAGGLPLGIIITSDETTPTLTKAFNKYRDILPDSAFFGKGKEGPAIFMTDNCVELRDALHSTWPNCILLLCLFHMMQQVWKWLMDQKNAVPKEDRQKLMTFFKSLGYENDIFSFQRLYPGFDNDTDLEENDFITSFPAFVTYLESQYSIRKSWALCYRSALLTRGQNTNNLAEAQFRVIKDKLLQRIKELRRCLSVENIFRK